MKVMDNIRKRGSVRSYDQTAECDFTLLEAKIAIVNSKQGPFGNKVNIQLVTSSEDSSQMKLGTYGMIKGAGNYLVVSCQQEENIFLDLGYLFEEVILYATGLGFGTVWMAGTFSRKHFKKAINFQDDELIPIVSPVGIEGSKKSLLSKIVAKPKTHVRKEFETLFTNADGTALGYKQGVAELEALEMVRLAPSAVNKQPWRVVKDGDEFHFYKIGSSEKLDIDLGIGLYHFDQTLLELGYQTTIEQRQDMNNGYVVTVTVRK